jgi:hypothetical protein
MLLSYYVPGGFTRGYGRIAANGVIWVRLQQSGTGTPSAGIFE